MPKKNPPRWVAPPISTKYQDGPSVLALEIESYFNKQKQETAQETGTEHFAVDFENSYFGRKESGTGRRNANRLACDAKSMNLEAFAGRCQRVGSRAGRNRPVLTGNQDFLPRMPGATWRADQSSNSK